MAAFKTLGAIFGLGLLVTLPVRGVDVNVLDPSEIIDSAGNVADANSNIIFVTVKNEHKFKAGEGGDVGGMGPFYDFARSIISTSLPGEFPFTWMTKVKDGTFDVGNDWEQITTDYLGYTIAIAVGLIFLLVFPIVGFCFCCCRCCGKCGGRRVITVPENGGYGKVCARRAALIICSSVVAAFAFTGSALMFATNENLSESIANFGGENLNKLDDVTDFFDSTIQQADQIVNTNFNFTLAVLFRDLDNIGYLLGKPIKENVISRTGLMDTYNNIDNLDSDAQKLNTSLETLTTEKANLQKPSQNFSDVVDSVQKDIDKMANELPDFASKCPNRVITITSFDVSALPSEQNKSYILNGFLKQGIRTMTQKSRDSLNAIPERIQNETADKRQELKDKAGNYSKDIQDLTKKLKNVKNDFVGNIDFDKLKSTADDFISTAVKYDKYRWYAGLALACITLIISLLLILGLVCGFCGGNAFVDPTERSSISHHGGNLLTSAVMLTFLFGWFIMLITTILFAVGAPVEKFGCSSLKDLTVLDKILDDYDLLGKKSGNASWLGEQIYPGKGVNLKISEVLKACQNGESAYTALRMEQGNIINLTEITDYSKTFSIGEQLDNFNVGFDGLNITSELIPFIDFMADFNSKMEYEQYHKILGDNPVIRSRVFLGELKAYLAQNPTPTLNAAQNATLNNINVTLEKHLESTGVMIESSINKTYAALLKINTTTSEPTDNTLKIRSDKLKQNLTDTEKTLESVTNSTFREAVKDFETRLKKIFDTFTADVKTAVEKEIGICKPLWNLFDDLLINGACDSAIGALNGWWCALGWTIFFLLLSICSSVSLSKHFFKMRYSEEKLSVAPHDTLDSSKPHHFNNKVFHADNPEGDKW